ncbi:hypothetical protein BTA51_11760 [Hahella sp. CCB-MM4]|uniref:energy transducer TonB n=1 Tax=Hahella sp. (strain CCB-MM4) TaxID=1926491 RepID=UPI000B9C5598|nr:energy transducer TonB [Hahella sp. CCB-MM4]OZG73161.1 hypothetical protein BTA51_11760 [Hahella sp. CCB-MM4]
MRYHAIGFSTALALHASLVAAGVWWYRDQAAPPPEGTPVAVAINQIGWSQPEPVPLNEAEPADEKIDQPVQENSPEPEVEPPYEVAEIASEPTPSPEPIVEKKTPENPETTEVAQQPAKSTPSPPEQPKETPVADLEEPKKMAPQKEENSEEPIQDSPQIASSAPGLIEEPAMDSPIIDPALEQDYLAALHRALQDAMQYPRRAKRRRQEGVALVEFTVYREGRLEGIQLRESSGFPILDEAALNTVRSIKQFKPIPEKLAKNMLTLAIPIRFELR